MVLEVDGVLLLLLLLCFAEVLGCIVHSESLVRLAGRTPGFPDALITFLLGWCLYIRRYFA